VLWQIEQTRLLKLPHVYLGYWIAESPKMAYKAQFRPCQVLRDGRWGSVGSAP
jgi:arginine-tRNA-protein transferase